MRVSFFLNGTTDLERLRQLDPDRDFGEFQTGERAWVLQTYLRLRNAGLPVDLVSEVPDSGIVIFTAKQKRAVQQRGHRGGERLLIGIREDVGRALIADCEVLQNGCFADFFTRFHIPLWPQPGLRPRDLSRGTGLHCVAYKGFLGNLHPDFLNTQWASALRQRGLEWRCDAVGYQGPQRGTATTDWQNFRDVDLALAVRPARADLHPRKPATKLYNSWLAGVPALLGPELAYRELRSSGLDYIEIVDAKSALCAIDLLRGDPQRYAAMVDNGARRARDFTPEAICARWIDLIFARGPNLLQRRSVKFWRGKPLWVKAGARRALSALRFFDER